jgi:hypothetical protein
MKRQINKKSSEVNEQFLELFEVRKQVERVLKRNFFKILFQYKTKTSSSINYLKDI